MSNIDYRFVQNEQGVLTFQSTVNSFGIENITQKDIFSFYMAFSSSAFLDTGLLPVDGTGLLAYRKADNHEQIVYQIKPGLYHINWGAHEGDSSAKTYYVAQPYRIVIADTLNGNLLGARTFYSPYPITSPLSELYHVNLPNINCKGYRGNCVGWICLYHSHDISNLPFNEKVSHILERCSGVETYNDANMSETDGPRFYQSFYEEQSHLSYLWNPQEWENRSNSQGYEWTLDQDLWIKVLVQDQDKQDKHYFDGQPLTIQMALLGNYQAYYTDQLIPKPINSLVRPDLTYSQEKLTSLFSRSYVNSSTVSDHVSTNVYSQSIQHREEKEVIIEKDLCPCCNQELNEDEEVFHVVDGIVCENCYNENYVFIESAENCFHHNDPNVFYDQYLEEYLHEEYIDEDEYQLYSCPKCFSRYIVSSSDDKNLNHVRYIPNQGSSIFSEGCFYCLPSSTENEHVCCSCKSRLPNPQNYKVHTINNNLYCNTCYINAPHLFNGPFEPTLLTCFCGQKHLASKFEPLSSVLESKSGKKYNVSYTKRYNFSPTNLGSSNLDKHNLYNLDPLTYEENLKEVTNIVSEAFEQSIPFIDFSKMFFACSSCKEYIFDLTLQNINSLEDENTYLHFYHLPFPQQSLVNCYVNVHKSSKESFKDYLINHNGTYSFRNDFPYIN